MRWSAMIVIVVIACAAGLISTEQIAEMDIDMEKQGSMVIDAAPYEESPAKLKKLIDTHRLFHEKIKITLASLVDDLRPYLESSDISELNEIIETILDQYNDDINKADEALLANDINLTDDLLMKITKELENIYITQNMIIDFRQKIAPQESPKKKILA